MSVARSRPDHNLCVAMNKKPLGVSEVRGQMASGGQTMDTEIAGVKSCGHGSRGDQSMWTRESLEVK